MIHLARPTVSTLFSLEVCYVLKSGDGRTYERTTCVKTIITTLWVGLVDQYSRRNELCLLLMSWPSGSIMILSCQVSSVNDIFYL